MGNKRTLTAATREAAEKCFTEGIVDAHGVVDRLAGQGHKITPNQVGGLLTLWKRRLSGASTGFAKSPDAVPSSTRNVSRDGAREERRREDDRHARTEGSAGEGPSDGFNWSSDAAQGGAGPGFGQAQIEISVKRISPPDGFLGMEPDGFTLAQLGQKYGGCSVYELTKYANGTKVGVVREAVGPTYGQPKNPRLSGIPRLVPAGEDADRPPPHRPPSGAGELNEVVSTIRNLKDMVKEDHQSASAAEAKIIDRALDAVTKKEPASDSMTAFLREQTARDERRQDAERERWENDRRDREAREERRRQDEKDAHDREMGRLRLEYEAREKEAKRLADEKDRRDKEHRDFMERIEKDREDRLQKSIEETNEAIAGVHASMKEELEKNLKHQGELAALERERLKNERDRDIKEIEALRAHQQEMYNLQLKLLPGSGNEKSTEMIVKVVQDALTKADQKANQVLEVKKMEKLIAAVGPENAKQLAMSFLVNGGVNLSDLMKGKGPASGAPRAAPQADDAPAAQAAPANPMGEAMNGIAQQVYGTAFFKDLVGIWAGHLRMKRTPFLFANQMAGYMLQDHRVELFYNYMAGLTWDEFLSEIKPHVPADRLPLFEAPEAAVFFDAVINLVAQRVEKDNLERGFVATPAPADPAPPAAPAEVPAQEGPK